MRIKANRKIKEGEERRRVILSTDTPNRPRIQKLKTLRELGREPDEKERPRVESDAALNQHISATLRAIRAARAQARNHDAELAQLRDETRSLIAEMQRDLNLNAA